MIDERQSLPPASARTDGGVEVVPDSLEQTLRRALYEHPGTERTVRLSLLVGPDVPVAQAASVTAAVNAVLDIAEGTAGARRVALVIGRRGDQVMLQARYDGGRPGDERGLDRHAARIGWLAGRLRTCDGTLEVSRHAGWTTLLLTAPAADARVTGGPSPAVDAPAIGGPSPAVDAPAVGAPATAVQIAAAVEEAGLRVDAARIGRGVPG